MISIPVLKNVEKNSVACRKNAGEFNYDPLPEKGGMETKKFQKPNHAEV